MPKGQKRRPDSLLVDIAAGEFEGATQAETCEALGITRQALSERVNRNKELFQSIKTAYYCERARLRAQDDHQASAAERPEA